MPSPTVCHGVESGLIGPGVGHDTQLDEHSELVGPDELADNAFIVKAQEVHYPFADGPTGGRVACVASDISAAQCLADHDGSVGADDHLLDLDVQVGEGVVVATDGHRLGRRTFPEGGFVVLALEISYRVVVPPVPDLVDELHHLSFACGTVHHLLLGTVQPRRIEVQERSDYVWDRAQTDVDHIAATYEAMRS